MSTLHELLDPSVAHIEGFVAVPQESWALGGDRGKVATTKTVIVSSEPFVSKTEQIDDNPLPFVAHIFGEQGAVLVTLACIGAGTKTYYDSDAKRLVMAAAVR